MDYREILDITRKNPKCCGNISSRNLKIVKPGNSEKEDKKKEE